MTYADLIARKRVTFKPRGLPTVADADLHPSMFHYQRDVTRFALLAGCAALFLDTGLGKTLCALTWGRAVVKHTGMPVLMFAPLAVAGQHAREAAHFGIDAKAIREQQEIDGARIYITNYDRADKFSPELFGGVILDESSILKSFTGATTRKLIAAFAETPFRLACTATPAPNDHTEIGTHAEFLGVMRRDEMLPRWFIHDSADTGTWRIKGHAVEDFWRWVASWARCLSKPSDLGHSDDGFSLPALTLQQHIVAADQSVNTGEERDGQARLFRIPDTSATAIHAEKRLTTDARSDVIARLVGAERSEPWVVWCDTDYEADALTARIADAVEVRGSMTPDQKEERLTAFSTGAARVIVTKPSVAGYGLNWQHCARMAFVGLSFSYENFYQAVRRSWRFGQKREVLVHVAMADTEKNIWEVVNRKAGDHDAMKCEMVKAMRVASIQHDRKTTYQPQTEAKLPAWIAA